MRLQAALEEHWWLSCDWWFDCLSTINSLRHGTKLMRMLVIDVALPLGYSHQYPGTAPSAGSNELFTATNAFPPKRTIH